MRAVMLEVPPELLEERRRRDLDRFDEVWEGVLHMVPPPSGVHQLIGARLFVVVATRAEALGLVATYEIGLIRPRWGFRDYRQPDILVARPEHYTRRGVEGPPDLVVEIRSPNDETYEKLPFYELMGAREFLVIDPPTRSVELFVLRRGKLKKGRPGPSGAVRSSVLGVTFSTRRSRTAPKLVVSWPGGTKLI